MYLLSDCCGPVGPGFVLANKRIGVSCHREQFPLESQLAYTFQRGVASTRLMLYRPVFRFGKIRLFLVSVNRGDIRHKCIFLLPAALLLPCSLEGFIADVMFWARMMF